MAGRLIDDDPTQALAHARAARALAGRIGPAREANGLVAYAAGEWTEALSELRAARRMTGQPDHLAVMADCERALGKPERALLVAEDPQAKDLEPASRVELMIVASGARRDLGQADAAVALLQVPALEGPVRAWTPRLRYAYADALLDAGREDEARHWFARTVEIDEHGQTDAEDRLLELDGLVFDDLLDEDDDAEVSAEVTGVTGVVDEDDDAEVRAEVTGVTGVVDEDDNAKVGAGVTGVTGVVDEDDDAKVGAEVTSVVDEDDAEVSAEVDDAVEAGIVDVGSGTRIDQPVEDLADAAAEGTPAAANSREAVEEAPTAGSRDADDRRAEEAVATSATEDGHVDTSTSEASPQVSGGAVASVTPHRPFSGAAQDEQIPALSRPTNTALGFLAPAAPEADQPAGTMSDESDESDEDDELRLFD